MQYQNPLTPNPFRNLMLTVTSSATGDDTEVTVYPPVNLTAGETLKRIVSTAQELEELHSFVEELIGLLLLDYGTNAHKHVLERALRDALAIQKGKQPSIYGRLIEAHQKHIRAIMQYDNLVSALENALTAVPGCEPEERLRVIYDLVASFKERRPE